MYISSITLNKQVSRQSIDNRLDGLRRCGYIIVDNTNNVQAIYNTKVEYAAKLSDSGLWSESFIN